jgi:ribosomal protein L35
MRKTLKLLSKRIRITKNKKVIHRQKGQGHNKAKDNPNIRRAKRKSISSQSSVIAQAIKNYS